MHPRTRRQVIQGLAGLSLSAGGLPWLVGCRQRASSAQQPGRVYRLGVLSSGVDVRGRVAVPAIDRIQPALAALGYIEGHNLTIEWRFSEGVSDRLTAYAVELVQSPVDVIAAPGALAVAAAMKATSTIPIVMAPAQDPVEQGFIAGFARPGGNVTGYASLGRPLAVTRLQVLKQALPGVAHVELLYPATPALLSQVHALEAAAPALGIQVRRLVASTPAELDAVFAATESESTDAVMALAAPFIVSNQERINAWTRVRRVPLSAEGRSWATSGALLTYGVDASERDERVAASIDKILRGAHPAELPVEQPSRFEMVINLQTARALGLSIAPSALAQATEVIQ